MKMKSALVVFCVLFLLLVPRVFAQNNSEGPDFDFERAYQDYVFVLDIYNSEHSQYLLAKAQYKQAGTLVSQTKAREETIDMLEARDDVVVTYLTAIRMKLLEGKGISDITKNGLFARLDAEIAWYKDHKAGISSAGTLADLADDSKEAKSRFKSLTQSLAYETLATIPFGPLSLMRDDANSILQSIRNKLFQVHEDGDIDTAIAERWAFEVESKITRSLDKEIDAQGLVPEITSKSDDLAKTYSNIIFKLEESKQFLRDATEYMDEIVREISFK